MKALTDLLKLLADTNRLRILMVLNRKELCVCQIMGVLELSQSLISKNLQLLDTAGFLSERRDGKLVFYSLKRDLPETHRRLISLLSELLGGGKALAADLKSLKDCEEFQKKTDRCDMKTFREFMNRRNKKKA